MDSMLDRNCHRVKQTLAGSRGTEYAQVSETQGRGNKGCEVRKGILRRGD